MIIIDDLLPKQHRLKVVTQLTEQIPITWRKWGDKTSNPVEDFCVYVWKQVFSKYVVMNSEGWEYWEQRFGPKETQTYIGFHTDNDLDRWVAPEEEQRLVDSGRVKTADYGFIYYAHTEPCVGGYLEIKRDNGELERIQPVPNRLILFTPNAQHRVTNVVKGYRRSIVSNLWKQTPSKYK